MKISTYIQCVSLFSVVHFASCTQTSKDESHRSELVNESIEIYDSTNNILREAYFENKDLFLVVAKKDISKTYRVTESGNLRVSTFVEGVGYSGPDIVFDELGTVLRFSYLGTSKSGNTSEVFKYRLHEPENFISGQIAVDYYVENDSFFIVLANFNQLSHDVSININKNSIFNFTNENGHVYGIPIQDYGDTIITVVNTKGIYKDKDSIYRKTYYFPKLRNIMLD